MDIPPSMLAQLAAQKWPGNVRELRNAADRFVLGLGSEDTVIEGDTKSLNQRVGEFERNTIAAELAVHGGSLKKTYESLDLSRKSLYEKMQKYGLSREDFSAGGGD
jgi:two-component system C4-dicarboxylate transport response regulator DctD